jgi:hypothetical protein
MSSAILKEGEVKGTSPIRKHEIAFSDLKYAFSLNSFDVFPDQFIGIFYFSSTSQFTNWRQTAGDFGLPIVCATMLFSLQPRPWYPSPIPWSLLQRPRYIRRTRLFYDGFLFLRSDRMVSGSVPMVFVSGTMVVVSKTMVSVSNTMVFDADQIVEIAEFPATVDFYHGICHVYHGICRFDRGFCRVYRGICL